MIDYIILTGLYMLIIYLIALANKDNSLVDIAWGPGFVLLAFLTLLQQHTMQSFTIFLLTCVWGLRLAAHIYRRHNGEDWRYRNWRRRWDNPAFDALVRVYLVQGVLMLIIALPLIYQQMTFFFYIGVLVWAYGFVWQIRGDGELEEHKRHSHGLLKKGSWKLTRHPNYFGEVVMWCGLFIASGVWWTIISPIAIGLVLWFVSIPMMEKKQRQKDGWHGYERNTPKLIPKKLW